MACGVIFVATYCNTLQHTHCNTHCHTLQHTLHHTATRYITHYYTLNRRASWAAACLSGQNTATQCNTHCNTLIRKGVSVAVARQPNLDGQAAWCICWAKRNPQKHTRVFHHVCEKPGRNLCQTSDCT